MTGYQLLALVLAWISGALLGFVRGYRVGRASSSSGGETE
jgi:hypothetical protein